MGLKFVRIYRKKYLICGIYKDYAFIIFATETKM